MKSYNLPQICQKMKLPQTMILAKFKKLALANPKVIFSKTRILKTLALANPTLANLQATHFQIIDVRQGMSIANDN